ncbi:hypothetical protein TWF694_005968 [Orbilia ellipsospora]|uniref:G-patch domain-containing protein n=1 Tax=Orbilia ellipsospora TaxID=2528407 RepID=A0AAV9WTI0_9PEZI
MASGSGKGLTSLYADLLEPESAKDSKPKPSTISKSPVIFAPSSTSPPLSTANGNEQPASSKKQVSSAALRFQPVPRRPPPTLQKVTKRAGINAPAKLPKPDTHIDHPELLSTPSGITPAARAPIVKSTLEDWATNDDDDVNGFYGGGSRQRGGRKRRKKNKDKESEKATQSWDTIYDPSRPNLYEEYRESAEKDQEMREWRDRLYGRRRAFSPDSSEDEGIKFTGNSFAPPPNLTFAPPRNLNEGAPQQPQNEAPPPLFEAATGDEIWMMRARMTQQAPAAPDGTPCAGDEDISPAPVNISRYTSEVETNTETSLLTPISGPNRSITEIQTSTISRAPVIYDLPPAQPDDFLENQDVEFDPDEDEAGHSNLPPDSGASRSARPGQRGFAERLMSKYGWTKGTGLGANSSGMVHALQVKAVKGKDNKGVGKILNKNAKKSEDEGKFGKMSEVVVLHKMVDGLESEDLAILIQEIGDECSEKYGRIERVQIVHRQSDETPSKVFVQFTSQLSALRAVNALEGRMFNGNIIEARFFDAEKFESQFLG